RWTTTDVTDANTNAITRLPVHSDPNEHIPDVAEAVVQSHDYRRHARETRNTPGVLHCQWILNVIAVFSRRRNVRCTLTGKQCEITRKQHHTRPVIDAQRNG